MGAETAIIGSTVFKMLGQEQEGELADQMGKNRRRMAYQAGDAAYARGTREATEIRRQGRQIEGDARAAMAAGGGVTDDAGAIDTLGDIRSVTNYNAMNALFGASEERRMRRYEGDVAKFEGRQAKKMSRLKMAGTALSGYAWAKK